MSRVGVYAVLLTVGLLVVVFIVVTYRFAKWKRDAQYWFIQDSLRHERLLNKVAEDLVSACCSGTQ